MGIFIFSNFFYSDAKGPFSDLKNYEVEFIKGFGDHKIYEDLKEAEWDSQDIPKVVMTFHSNPKVPRRTQ